MSELTSWRRREGEMFPFVRPSELRRQFDELIERFFGEEPVFSERATSKAFLPAIDIYETDDEIMVKAEIPGIEQKDLDINLSGDVLIIKGEKKEETEERKDNFYRVERVFGTFSRSLLLPCEVQEDKVDATYKNGILSLRMPKVERYKRKAVKITVH